MKKKITITIDEKSYRILKAINKKHGIAISRQINDLILKGD